MPWIKHHITNHSSLLRGREPGEDRFFHIIPELQRSVEYHADINTWLIRQINISRSMNDLRIDIFARNSQAFFTLTQALGPTQYYETHMNSIISFTVDEQYKKLQTYFFKQLLTVQPEIEQICDDLGIRLESSCSFDDLQQWYKNIDIPGACIESVFQ